MGSLNGQTAFEGYYATSTDDLPTTLVESAQGNDIVIKQGSA